MVGDFGVCFEVYGEDELVILGCLFNVMVDSIEV